MLHRHSIVAIIIALFATLSFNVAAVYADDNNDAIDQPAAGETIAKEGATIEISPLTKRVALKAGEAYTSSINVKNTGTEATTISVYAAPFSVSEDGKAQVFDTETTYTQISRWVTIKNSEDSYESKASFKLEPGDDNIIDYKISVPEDVPGGGQYAVLFVETLPEDKSEDVIHISSRVGMTIYATMPGEPNRSVHLGDTSVNSIVTDGNIGVQTHVKNEGNIDFQTSVEVKAYSIFGKQLYSDSILASVLPESSKTISVYWKNAPTFGLYRLEYAISALDIYTTGSHIILVMTPLVMILAIILLLGTIIGIAYLVRRRSANKKSDGPSIIIG